jgi:hypothetical protein
MWYAGILKTCNENHGVKNSTTFNNPVMGIYKEESLYE